MNMVRIKIPVLCLLTVAVTGQENYNAQNNYNQQNYNPPNNVNPPTSFPNQNNYPNSNNFPNQNNYPNPNQNNYPNTNQNNYPNPSNFPNPTNFPNQNNFPNDQNNFPNQYNNNQNNYNNNNNNQNYNYPRANSDDCCEEYCYEEDPEPYLHFSTKTAYESLNRRSGNQHIVPDCRPVQFWSIIRRGTSLPDADTIRMMRNIHKLQEDIIRNHEQRRSYPDKGKLCPKDYELFKRWRFNESINENNANTLSNQGITDMKLLARRYKTKFPEILQNYDERAYSFQYSPDTSDSFQAYIEGLFENESYKVHANIVNGRRLTRPPQDCPKWQEFENSQFVSVSEVQRFKSKPEFHKMAVDVFTRLGYRFMPNETVIQDMYNLCRYEKAWNPQPKAPWCIAFNKNQLKLLEYAEDLKYYYESGYGNKMGQHVGCNPLKDLYDRFERTVNGNSDGNKASFIFSETEIFQLTLTTLGIARDDVILNSENYYQQSRRKWKTSEISPFAANLVATLYECNRDEKYRVMFFINEIPVDFPDCAVGLCNWSTVQQKYQDIVRNCNLDNFCSGRSGAVSSYVTSSVLLTVLLMFRV